MQWPSFLRQRRWSGGEAKEGQQPTSTSAAAAAATSAGPDGTDAGLQQGQWGGDVQPDPTLGRVGQDGKILPPKPHPLVKAAGIGPDPPLPPEVTAHPADAWQPPRLRTVKPLSTFKYQYRGGWNLFFDCSRVPLACFFGFIAMWHIRDFMFFYMYGPVDPDALSVYHEFDQKRPGQWPPHRPQGSGEERVFGARHEIRA